MSTTLVTTTPAKIDPACQTSYESFIKNQLIASPTIPQHCNVYQGVGRFDTTRTHPECASKYESATDSYDAQLASITQPSCTGAAITGALCQSVRDNWQKDINFNFDPYQTYHYRLITSHGSLNVGPDDAFTWLASSTLGVARGCTLGCGRCEVTATGTAKLLYWPEATHTTTHDGAEPLVTAVTLGTTFTSPTVYVSYPGLHGSNACSEVGTNIGETILAIPPQSTLSSMYGLALPCGNVQPSDIKSLTAPFTYADLKEPVPYSIYSSQPSCQINLRTGRCNGTCSTTEPYRPILIIPDGVYRSVQPAWAECWHDVHGVEEIPVALTGTTAPAGKVTSAVTLKTTTSAAASPPKTSSTPAPTPA
ncbi:hypothetical protein AMS68_000015 [Peltaster fructicola]|uniref:Uncharacterized protein n=1 Tax=Peltaster fructicola TaxID=286661 RepID=A0A6H0XIM7_9PEZI|nr:hypothetical protein AMS68_000015 [Peltaster fructicola]